MTKLGKAAKLATEDTKKKANGTVIAPKLPTCNGRVIDFFVASQAFARRSFRGRRRGVGAGRPDRVRGQRGRH